MYHKAQDFIASHVRFFLLILFLFSFGIRLYKLNQIPTTLTHDESVYAIQAKSLALQGKTWDQKLGWFPLQPVDPWYAEWPASVMAPFFWLTENPLLAARLPSAIMGAILPFLLGGIVWSWWRNRELAVWTIIISVFNPFLWQFSRLAYDALYSTFFYFLGALVLLQARKYWKLCSLFFFVFGFFQYQGFKLLLLPWVAGVLAIQWLAQMGTIELKKKSLIKIVKNISGYEIAVILGCLGLALVYGFILLPSQDVGNRLSYMIWNDSKLMSNETNILRRLSLASPFIKLQANKLTIMLDFIVSHFFQTFNPQHLFLSLDASVNGFAAWRHGLFYLIDVVLLALGFGTILKEKKFTKSRIGFLCLLGVLTFPALINTQSEWYELRAFMVYALLPIVIGFGVLFLKQFPKIFPLFLVIYTVSVISFGFHYFVRYPVYSADMARFVERVTARYIEFHQERSGQTVTIVAETQPDSRYLFANYLLYTSAFTKESASQIAQSVNEKTWQLNNVHFSSSCISPDELANKTLIYLNGFTICKVSENNPAIIEKQIQLEKSQTITIPAINDSGAIFKITGDQVCNDLGLLTFISPKSLSVFQLKNLTREQFCQSWLTDVSSL